MASFTDNSNLNYLTSFPGYVQQLPVETMAQVGQMKQGQYDAGVQKIQAQINQVAGIDVARDVDKAYLESKLNTLKGDLRKVAAGDFSNYQLVNSVGGMVNNIAKDKNVQNAAYSTIKYRSELSNMQKDIDEGSSNPANIYNFNKKASSWLMGKNPGEVFSGQYTPYFDVDKFTREAFDAVKPDGYSYEQIYVTDENGKTLTQKVVDPITGKVKEEPILSPVMTRLKKEGRFPDKVRQTLDHIFSDARVSQQLNISGEYTYQGNSPEQLREQINLSKNKELSSLDNSIKELQLKKVSGENVQFQLDEINNRKKRITSQYDELLAANPDYLRGLLYKESVKNNYTSMYTNIEEERSTHENPGWSANFKLQQEANRVAEHRDDLRYKYASLAQDERQFQDKQRLDILKELGSGTTSSPTLGPLPSNSDVVFSFDENYKQSANQFNAKVDDLLVSTTIPSDNLSDELNDIMSRNKNLSREDAIRTVINQEAERNNMTPEEYRANWYNKALNQLNYPGTNLTPENKDRKEAAQESENTFKQLSSIKNQLEQIAPTTNNELLSNLNNIDFKIFKIFGKNKEISLTPQDQYDIALVKAGGIFSSDNVASSAKSAQKRLEERGLSKSDVDDILEQTYSGRIYTKNRTGGYEMDPNKLKFGELLRNITNENNEDYINKRAEAIKKVYEFNPNLEKNVITGKKEADVRTAQEIVTLISKYKNIEQNYSPNFLDNSDKMANIALESSSSDALKKGNIKLVTDKNEVTGEVVPRLIFSDRDGAVQGEMTITPDEALNIGYDVNSWYQPPEVKLAEMLLKSKGTSTTASGDILDPYTYRVNDVLLNKSQFPLLSKLPYDIKANISFSNGGYYPYLYINDGENEYIKPFPTKESSMYNAMEKLKGINIQTIQQIIAEQK